MTLDQIRYLLAIDEYHSLHAASEHLFITPQALSQSLSSLEKELNLKLTEGSRNGTYLTSDGHIILETGAELLRVIRELQEAATPVVYNSLPKANLSILTVPGMAHTLIPQIISNLYRDYPDIKIKLEAKLNSMSIMDLLSRQRITNEFAFVSVFQMGNTMFPDVKDYPNIAFTPLVSTRYCVSVPKGHALAHLSEVSMKMIMPYPIMILKDTEDIWLPVLRSYGNPQKIVSIEEYAVFNQLTRQNNSFLFLSRLTASTDSPGMMSMRKHIPLVDNLTNVFGYVTRTDCMLSEVSEEFLDSVRRYCAKQYQPQPLL